MKLREYLYKKKYSPERMSLKTFAESIELSATHISSYISGRNRMSRKVAKAIERVTNGEVTAQDVMNDNPVKTKKYC
jgi:DNA-binding transcriptional regulator YdaS (Cro superfamily)